MTKTKSLVELCFDRRIKMMNSSKHSLAEDYFRGNVNLMVIAFVGFTALAVVALCICFLLCYKTKPNRKNTANTPKVNFAGLEMRNSSTTLTDEDAILTAGIPGVFTGLQGHARHVLSNALLVHYELPCHPEIICNSYPYSDQGSTGLPVDYQMIELLANQRSLSKGRNSITSIHPVRVADENRAEALTSGGQTPTQRSNLNRGETPEVGNSPCTNTNRPRARSLSSMSGVRINPRVNLHLDRPPGYATAEMLRSEAVITPQPPPPSYEECVVGHRHK